MDYAFYDVKKKEKVTAKVIDRVTFQNGQRTSYALKGKTSDGRNLTAIVSKAIWEKAK